MLLKNIILLSLFVVALGLLVPGIVLLYENVNCNGADNCFESNADIPLIVAGALLLCISIWGSCCFGSNNRVPRNRADPEATYNARYWNNVEQENGYIMAQGNPVQSEWQEEPQGQSRWGFNLR